MSFRTLTMNNSASTLKTLIAINSNIYIHTIYIYLYYMLFSSFIHICNWDRYVVLVTLPYALCIYIYTHELRITYFCCHFRPLLAYKIGHRCRIGTKFCIDSSNPPLWRSWKFQHDRSSQFGCTFSKWQ